MAPISPPSRPQSDFLYERKGPWPQPSPGHPLGEAPEVMHIPWSEWLDWQLHIGSRYVYTLLTYWPVALAKALKQPGIRNIDDFEFNRLMTTSIYSKFLTPTLDTADQKFFDSITAGAPATTRFWKIDFTPIAGVEPYEGMYVAPTVTAFRQDSEDGPRVAVAIRINDVLLTPADSNAWKLARYFVLQGAAYATLFTEHPNLHFPLDAINAITKSSVPKDHLLMKLMLPHMRFTLKLNHEVLESPATLVSNKRKLVYDPFCAAANKGLMDFFVAGYHGIPGNSAYPRYQYRKRPKKVYSSYGDFLDAYYVPIYDFVKEVVKQIPKNDPWVALWAKYIHNWIPGFPGPEQIFEGDNLAAVVAGYIWDVSVGHAVDHQTYVADMPLDLKCFRLRVPPPTQKDIPAWNLKSLSRRRDQFKTHLTSQIFFRPVNVTRLYDTRYGFDDPDLIKLNEKFLVDLRATEAALKTPNFLPLAEISRSIQY